MLKEILRVVGGVGPIVFGLIVFYLGGLALGSSCGPTPGLSLCVAIYWLGVGTMAVGVVSMGAGVWKIFELSVLVVLARNREKSTTR